MSISQIAVDEGDIHAATHVELSHAYVRYRELKERCGVLSHGELSRVLLAQWDLASSRSSVLGNHDDVTEPNAASDDTRLSRTDARRRLVVIEDAQEMSASEWELIRCMAEPSNGSSMVITLNPRTWRERGAREIYESVVREGVWESLLLETSYRCGPRIVDALNLLSSSYNHCDDNHNINDSDLCDTDTATRRGLPNLGKLKCGSVLSGTTSSPEGLVDTTDVSGVCIWRCSDPLEEAHCVADEVEGIIKRKNVTPESDESAPILPFRIGVLSRTNQSLRHLADDADP